MSNTDLDKNDQLIQAMQKDLNRLLAEDAVFLGSQPAGTREAMSVVMTDSVRTQRLYFVVRSLLMSLISALIYFLVVLYLGAIDAFQAALLGVFVFVASLITSRLFDKQIVQTAKKIIIFLNKHERLRKFVLKKL